MMWLSTSTSRLEQVCRTFKEAVFLDQVYHVVN